MDKQTKEQGQKYSNNVIDSMKDILNKLNSEDDNEHDSAVEELFHYGLSISKEIVINYLISWGGPAYRLQITFNEDNELVSIKPQYQDWFTKWVTMDTTEEQDKILNDFVFNLHLEEIVLNQ